MGSVFEVWKLGHVVQFLCCLLSTNLSLHDMGLQSLVEICHAYRCVDYCEDNQDNGDNSETRQTLSDWEVVVSTAWLIHSCKLEDEVCHSTEEEEDGPNHSNLILSSSPESCHEEDENRDGDCGDGKAEFSICQSGNNNQELNCES